MRVEWNNVGNNAVEVWEATVGDFTLTVSPSFNNLNPFKFFVSDVNREAVDSGSAKDLDSAMSKASLKVVEIRRAADGLNDHDANVVEEFGETTPVTEVNGRLINTFSTDEQLIDEVTPAVYEGDAELVTA